MTLPQASTYQCPFCRRSIATDDVNVATDIALCRGCGKTSSFAMVARGAGAAWDATTPPPRWVRVETNFRGATQILYKKISPIVWFLIPFTALWSGGSMSMIYGRQMWNGKFEVGLSLFGLPFLIGTIVLLCVTAFCLFGKWLITLDNGTGSVFAGVGPLGWTRRFSYDRSSLVSLRMTNIQINNVPQEGILVRTADKDFTFGTSFHADAKRFIAATIMNEVAERR